jgi:hypothetical protein
LKYLHDSGNSLPPAKKDYREALAGGGYAVVRTIGTFFYKKNSLSDVGQVPLTITCDPFGFSTALGVKVEDYGEESLRLLRAGTWNTVRSSANRFLSVPSLSLHQEG